MFTQPVKVSPIVGENEKNLTPDDKNYSKPLGLTPEEYWKQGGRF